MINLTRQEKIEQLIAPYVIDKIQESIYLQDLIDPIDLLAESEYDDNSLEAIASVSLNAAENIYDSVKRDLELSEYSDDIVIQAVATAISLMVTKERNKHDSFIKPSTKEQFDYMEATHVPLDVLHDIVLNVIEERKQEEHKLK